MKSGGVSFGTLLAAALPATTIVTAVVVGVSLGVELALLVVAGGALAGVIALIFASVLSLTGESPLTLEEAITLGAPSAEEEQKRSVLRALKDLEFERGVGKISEDDYAELSERYRAEARRLMQVLDEGAQPERDRAEKALRERLEKAGVKGAPGAKATTGDAPSPEAGDPDAAPAEGEGPLAPTSGEEKAS